MRAERSQRVEQLYHAARERDPRERAAFLEQACAGDDALRREVESLLAEDTGVHSFLETPAVELAKTMSGNDSGQSMIGRQFGSYRPSSMQHCVPQDFPQPQALWLIGPARQAWPGN